MSLRSRVYGLRNRHTGHGRLSIKVFERQCFDYLVILKTSTCKIKKLYKLTNYTTITRINRFVYKTVSPHNMVYHLITHVSMVPHEPEHGTPLVGYHAHFFMETFYFSIFSILFGNDISTNYTDHGGALHTIFQCIISRIFLAQEELKK